MKKGNSASRSPIGFGSVSRIVLGAALVSFGIYNLHEPAAITEGGILGTELLLERWLGLSPAFTSILLNAAAFLLGWRALGGRFLILSAISVGSFSLCYALVERTPRLFPRLAAHPLAAAIVGALFVGIGAGLSVREGAAQSGDDAIALALRHFRGWKVSSVYLVSDLAVLLLSLSYIPPRRILYSLLTVLLSGRIIEAVVRFRGKKG